MELLQLTFDKLQFGFKYKEVIFIIGKLENRKEGSITYRMDQGDDREDVTSRRSVQTMPKELGDRVP